MALDVALLVRNGVATANTLTASLQGPVRHSAWVREDAFGKPIYGRRVEGLDIYSENPDAEGVYVDRQALVEYQTKTREVNGRLVVSYAVITFIHPFEAAPLVTERREPVDPRDRMLLPNGKTGPIIDVQGLIDPLTSAPYFVQVWLGALADRGI